MAKPVLGAVLVNCLTRVSVTRPFLFDLQWRKQLKSFFAACLIAASVTWAADTSVDGGFWYRAAASSSGEIELGQLAQEKGLSAAVKQLGAMMVKDHSATRETLRAAVVKKQLELPARPTAGQIAEKAKLQNLEGESFDKEYVRSVMDQHKEDISIFEQEAQSGADPEFKAFATATLPTLKMHLQAAEAVATKLHLKLEH